MREPCWQMDKIAEGLKRMMANDLQGVMGSIVKSGQVLPDDEIILLPESFSLD